MVGRRVAGLIPSLLALTLAACGDGGGSASAGRFADEANALCRETRADLEEVEAQLGADVDLERAFEQVEKEMGELVANARRLEPPDEVASEFHRWTDLLDAQVTLLAEALKKSDDEMSIVAMIGPELVSKRKEANTIARKLGLDDCVDEDTEVPEAMTLPRPPSELTQGERARFDARIAAELDAGRVRKAAAIAANRKALESLPRFPGSDLVSEELNSEASFDYLSKDDPGESEFHLYASSRLSDEDYELLSSEDWGTFRTYRLPKGTRTDAVYDFFTQRLLETGWDIKRDESGPGLNGIGFHDVSFARGARCIWFFIGLKTTPFPPGRAFEVATDRGAREGC
jgi:hypothetical protein